MSAIGGSPKEISWKGRIFACTGDSPADINYGGVSVERPGNGDGSVRKLITKVGWKITGLAIVIDHSRGDAEWLSAEHEKEDGDFTITFNDETVYNGIGGIEGEFTNDIATASSTVDFAGGGKLKKA